MESERVLESDSELVARIQSFLRRRERSRSGALDGGRLKIADAMLVRDTQTLSQGSKETTMTALKFRVLWFLGDAEGKLLTRAQILDRVWNDLSGVPTRVVDVLSLPCGRSSRRYRPSCRSAASAGSVTVSIGFLRLRPMLRGTMG
jgi:Transcriptional regulatory protein, C terminal